MWQGYRSRMLRAIRSVLAVTPLVVLGQLSSTACSCGDVNCAGAAVYVDLGTSNEASAARICIDGTCKTVPRATVGATELFFDDIPVTVHDDEDFELSITVLGREGAELATLTETRNNDVDPCRCVGFEYDWDRSSEIERTH
jgi:hypothetical protein